MRGLVGLEGSEVSEHAAEIVDAQAKVDRVEALYANYMAWDGNPDSEFSSSPRQREQLRAALDGCVTPPEGTAR